MVALPALDDPDGPWWPFYSLVALVRFFAALQCMWLISSYVSEVTCGNTKCKVRTSHETSGA